MTQSTPQILTLSFHKELPEIAFYEFEKLLVFGLSQLLTFYSGCAFVDYAIPAHRLMPKLVPDEKAQAQELTRLGRQFQCSHVLYGILRPQTFPTDRIEIDMRLFDLEHQVHLLQVTYHFTDFENETFDPALFLPTWLGLQHGLQWMACQIIGAVQPHQASALWPGVQTASLAKDLKQFKQLAHAFYLSSDAALLQKRILLEGLLQDAPDLFIARYELGMVEKRLRNYPKAITDLEKAKGGMQGVNHAMRAICINEMGVCHALCDNMEAACQCWQLATSVDPAFATPYLNLGHAMEQENLHEEAEYFFVEATRVAPEDNRAYSNLARLYSKLERWDEALTQYQYMVTLSPDDPWILSDLANCELQRGNITKAIGYLQKTLELDAEGEAGRCAHYILTSLQAAEV